jgi:predicted metal-binding protein
VRDLAAGRISCSAPRFFKALGELKRVSDLDSISQATVLVCVTCRTTTAPSAGAELAEATLLAAHNVPDVSVLHVRCLGNCSRGLSAAIRYENAWTYVFGGLDPALDGPSLIIAARLLAQAGDGIMPWRGRPNSLKRGLIARIPPVDFREEPL